MLTQQRILEVLTNIRNNMIKNKKVYSFNVPNQDSIQNVEFLQREFEVNIQCKKYQILLKENSVSCFALFKRRKIFPDSKEAE